MDLVLKKHAFLKEGETRNCWSLSVSSLPDCQARQLPGVPSRFWWQRHLEDHFDFTSHQRAGGKCAQQYSLLDLIIATNIYGCLWKRQKTPIYPTRYDFGALYLIQPISSIR